MTTPMTYGIKKSKRTGKLAFSGPCPACNSELKLTEDEIGRRQQCPNCRTVIRPVSAILQAYRLNSENEKLRERCQATDIELGMVKASLKETAEDRQAQDVRINCLDDQVESLTNQMNDLKAERKPVAQPAPQTKPVAQPAPQSKEPQVPRGLAAVLSIFIPGLGQLALCRFVSGISLILGSSLVTGFGFFHKVVEIYPDHMLSRIEPRGVNDGTWILTLSALIGMRIVSAAFCTMEPDSPTYEEQHG